jgi:Cu/Ag efflux protein CusF
MALVFHPVWALAALALAADGDIVVETGADGIFFGHGIVRSVEPATGTLTLDHGAIKGCMPAMTMMYRVARPDLSRILRPGDVVDFTIDGGKYTILEATVVRRSAPDGAVTRP